MEHQFDSGIPIYIQLIRRMKVKIVSGQWGPGGRVPPVRDLALEFGVNPNTMQRSLAELEREGLVHSERTAGRFITEDQAMIDAIRTTMSREEAERFRGQMHMIGFTDEQILAALRELIDESKTKGENT